MRPTTLTGRQPCAQRSAPDAAAASYITRITSIPEPLSRGRGKPTKLGLADILPLQKVGFPLGVSQRRRHRSNFERNGEGECGVAGVASGLNAAKTADIQIWSLAETE